MTAYLKLALAGGAALAIAGVAVAASHDLHHLDVALPGGGVAQIGYRGDVAPTVTISPGAAAPLAHRLAADMRADVTAFDRLFATMSAQMAAAQEAMAADEAAAVHDLPGAPLSRAALQSLPPGTVSFSEVTTINGDKVCTRSVTMTAARPGAQPQLLHKASGDCAADAARDNRPVLAAAPPAMRATPPAPLQRVAASY